VCGISKHVLTARVRPAEWPKPVAISHALCVYVQVSSNRKNNIVCVVRSSCAVLSLPQTPSKAMKWRRAVASMCISQPNNDYKTIIARQRAVGEQGDSNMARPTSPRVVRQNIHTKTRGLVRQIRRKQSDAEFSKVSPSGSGDSSPASYRKTCRQHGRAVANQRRRRGRWQLHRLPMVRWQI
jgi:hypothetical protein